MTLTTAEVLTVNGVNLNTLAKNVETLGSRLVVPARRGENIILPGRHGRLRTPKRFDELSLILPMWVLGCDDDGAIPGGSTARKEFYKRVDELTRLFTVGQYVELRHTTPAGTIRKLTAEVKDTINFATAGSNPRGKFAVAMVAPEPFWSDTSTVNNVVNNAGSFSLTNFAGATAPMDDLTVVFAGVCMNPRLTDTASGGYVEYQAALTTGQSITINAATWTLIGGGGHTADYSKLVHVGDPRWFVLSPSATSPAVSVSQTAGSPNFTTTVTGYRKYLVG